MSVYLTACPRCGDSCLTDSVRPPKRCQQCGVQLGEEGVEEYEDVSLSEASEGKAPPKADEPHRKRCKLKKILKAVVGEEALEVLGDRALIKMAVGNRVSTALRGRITEEERKGLLSAVDKAVDEVYDKTEEKLK